MSKIEKGELLLKKHELLKKIQDSTWIIRKVPIKEEIQTADGATGQVIDPNQPTETIFDLGAKIDEPLYSLEDAFLRSSGQDGWQDLFQIQLNRRFEIERSTLYNENKANN